MHVVSLSIVVLLSVVVVLSVVLQVRGRASGSRRRAPC